MTTFWVCSYFLDSLYFWPAEMIDSVEAALAQPSACEATLRLLLETKPNTAVLASPLPAVLDRVIDSTLLTAIGLAREVIAAYGTELAIRSRLLFAETYLTINEANLYS
jgi:hypothetical protein